MRLDKESRKIGSSGGHRSFPKIKGDDKKHEMRFKQIERTLKIKIYKGNRKYGVVYVR